MDPVPHTPVPDDSTPVRRGFDWVKSLIWTLLLTGVMVMVIGSLRGGPVAQGPAAPLVGVDLSGTTHNVAQLHGKPVLLYFWASWCSACTLTSPTVDQYAAAHPELTVLGVAMESEEAVRLGLGKTRRSFPIVPMTEEIAAAWPVRALPTTVLVDERGMVAWQRVGVLLPGELHWHVGL